MEIMLASWKGRYGKIELFERGGQMFLREGGGECRVTGDVDRIIAHISHRARGLQRERSDCRNPDSIGCVKAGLLKA